MPPFMRRLRHIVMFGSQEFVSQEGPEVRPLTYNPSCLQHSYDFSLAIAKVPRVLCIAVIPATKMKSFLLPGKLSLPMSISAADIQTLCPRPIEKWRRCHHGGRYSIQRQTQYVNAISSRKNRFVISW